MTELATATGRDLAIPDTTLPATEDDLITYGRPDFQRDEIRTTLHNMIDEAWRKVTAFIRVMEVRKARVIEVPGKNCPDCGK